MATLINQDGTDKNDVLTYDKGGDGVVYHTMAGNDKVTIAGDSIALVNDAGSDTITITGGSGHSIEGNGASVETIIIDGGAAVSAELGDGRDVITIIKSSGRTSTGASSSIRGGGWTDTFTTEAGAQNYQLYGEAGDDIFNINGGKNMNFWGGAANDTFVVTGGSNNKLYGGDSDDVFEISAASQNMILGYGKDTVNVKAGDNQQIKGNLGINTINLLAGSGHVITSDIDQVASKKAGKDVGYGVDKVIIDGASQVTANLGDGKDVVEINTGSGHMIYTEGWGDTVTISGTVSDSAIDTGAGDDMVIINGGTNNTIVVGEGNDTITLNDGSVGVLNGESGSNTITVNGGSVESIVGAFVQVGSTAGNKITITGGSVTGEEIVGSTNKQGGSITNNIVTITGGSFGKNEEGQAITSVYGGRNDNDVVNYNQVSVSAGDFVDIYGGYQGVKAIGGTGVAVENNVVVDGTATAAKIVGGHGTATTNRNTVTVDGQVKVGEVFGGIGTYGATAENKVTLQGDAEATGQVVGAAFSGNGARIEGNQVLITDNAKAGSVIAAYVKNADNRSTSSAQNKVTLSGNAVVAGDVYGVYNEQSGVYAAGNTIDITDKAMVNGSVVGVYSKQGSAESNTINISGGSVTNFQWTDDGHFNSKGGDITVAKTVDQNAVSNRLNMTGGEATIIRGGRATGKGYVGYNRVYMTGGTAVAVDGGYSNDGNAKDNWVEVTGGMVISNIEGFEARVLGGRSYNGEAGYNNVTVKNMKQSELKVIGGQVINGPDGAPSTGLVRGNTVIVENCQLRNVISGQNLGTGNATEGFVNVINSQVSEQLDTAAFSALANPYNYAVVGNIGHGALVNYGTVIVSGGQVSAVYGNVNNSATGSVEYTRVTLQNGVIVNYNVYGGFAHDGDVTNSIIEANKAVVTGYDESIGGGEGGMVMGGYTNGGLAKENTVTFNDGKAYMLRGGRSATGNAVANIVNLNGGTVDYVEGGRSNNALATENKVVITGATVTQSIRGGRVVAANLNIEGKAMARENSVEINGGVVNKVYGGFATTSGDIIGNKVTIQNATVKGSVWGGYTPKGVASGNDVSLVETVVEGNVYNSVSSGESANSSHNLILVIGEKTEMGKITLQGSNTNVKGTVYGGLGVDTIELWGSKAGAIDGGSGNDQIDTYAATVETIKGGAGNDTININGGTMTSVDGGEGNDAILLNECDVLMVNGGDGDDIITISKAESLRITGGAGNDTYKFERLKDDASYIVNEKGASKDEYETFDLTNYNQEDIAISYSGSDMKLKAENGATITIKNYNELYHMMFEFKDGALGFEKAEPRYTTEENQVMVFGSK